MQVRFEKVFTAGILLLCAGLVAGCMSSARPPREDLDKISGHHYRWAQEQYNRGRYLEALESINKAIELVPDDYTHYYMRAHIYLAAGQHAECIVDLERVIEMNPFFTDARNTMGVAFAAAGDTEQAFTAFDLALEDHKYAYKQKIYYNRGNIYFDGHQFERAIEEYRLALTADPDYARAHFKLGRALQEIGRGAEAEQEFDEVLRLVPPRSELAREVEMILRAADPSAS